MSTSTEAKVADVKPDIVTHTPGPWRSVSNTGYVQGGDCTVAVVGAYRDKEILPYNRERWDADARLIAAAPSLLAVLKCVIADLPSKRDWLDPVLERAARDVVARAEGRTP